MRWAALFMAISHVIPPGAGPASSLLSVGCGFGLPVPEATAVALAAARPWHRRFRAVCTLPDRSYRSPNRSINLRGAAELFALSPGKPLLANILAHNFRAPFNRKAETIDASIKLIPVVLRLLSRNRNRSRRSRTNQNDRHLGSIYLLLHPASRRR